MDYKCVTNLDDVKRYINGARITAFDFETAPDEMYRKEERAALNAHKSHIVGISFSVRPEAAIYVPVKHRRSRNVNDRIGLWVWLTDAVFQNPDVIKVAHNLSFETMFLRSI